MRQIHIFLNSIAAKKFSGFREDLNFFVVETEGKSGGIKFGTRKNLYIIATTKTLEELNSMYKISGARGVDVLYKDTVVYSKNKSATNGYNSEYGRGVGKLRDAYESTVNNYLQSLYNEETKKKLKEQVKDAMSEKEVVLNRRKM